MKNVNFVLRKEQVLSDFLTKGKRREKDLEDFIFLYRFL